MNKNRASKFMAIACAGALMVSSFAYFTDRAEFDVSVTSGTVGIAQDASTNWLNQLKDGPQSLDNINPGDSRSLKFTVTNTDNKAVDVRHTIKLSVVDAAGNAKAMSMRKDIAGEKSSLGDDATKMLQFDIFKATDVLATSNENNNAGYKLKEGAQPVFSSDSVNATSKMGASRVIDEANGTVTYYFADSVLNGSQENADANGVSYAKEEQVATDLVSGAADKNDITLTTDGTAVTYDYVLIYRDNTLNDFQGCQLHAELVVEAKQHLNTASSWENVYTNEYVLNASGMPTQDTIIATVPDNQTGVLNENNNAVVDGSHTLNHQATGNASQYNTQDDSGYTP